MQQTQLSGRLEAELRRRAESAQRTGSPLRAWVSLGGSGALPYGVAIVLIEALGRRWREARFRVLATDTDPAAVARARAGLFQRDDMPWLSDERRERFFFEEAGGWRARPLLREVCLFTTQDAARATPLTRSDWVVTAASESQHQAGEAFVDEVVHELRSPVAVIQGFAQALRLGVRKPRERAAFLRSIESQSARIARLVDRLLDLSAAGQGSRTYAPTELPAAKTIWKVAADFAPLARRRGVKLKIDVDAGLPLSVDSGDFPHILGNLLDNAIKFSARGDAVTVRGRAQGDQAILSVEDAGPGLPSGDFERIFERFYRGKRTRDTKGTGLGLAIVRALVKGNGGRVWARNGEGRGAVFFVSLPLAPARRPS